MSEINPYYTTRDFAKVIGVTTRVAQRFLFQFRDQIQLRAGEWYRMDEGQMNTALSLRRQQIRGIEHKKKRRDLMRQKRKRSKKKRNSL